MPRQLEYENYVIRNVKRIEWCNFEGRNTNGYNPNNKKSFVAVLNEEDAAYLEEKMVHVYRKAFSNDPDAELEPYINVKINFREWNGRLEPVVYKCIDKSNPVLLDDITSAELDSSIILGAHIEITLSNKLYKSPGDGNEYRPTYLKLGYFDVDGERVRSYGRIDPFKSLYE